MKISAARGPPRVGNYLREDRSLLAATYVFPQLAMTKVLTEAQSYVVITLSHGTAMTLVKYPKKCLLHFMIHT